MATPPIPSSIRAALARSAQEMRLLGSALNFQEPELAVLPPFQLIEFLEFVVFKDEGNTPTDTPLRMVLLLDWIDELKRQLPFSY